MSADAVVASGSLARVQGHPHLRGLWGLTLAELRRWFPVRAMVFAAGGVAVLAFARVVWSAEESAKLGPLLWIFFSLWTGLLVVSTVATTQGAVASEIEEGTASWLVAKPIGRPAFVLSKFFGAIPAVLIAMVGVPGVVARFVFADAADRGRTDFRASQVIDVIANPGSREEFTPLPEMGRYVGLLALIAALVLFVVAVMVLLGCVVRVQFAVFGLGLALPVGLLLVGQLAPEALAQLTPGWVYESIVDTVAGDPVPVLAPIVVSGAWIALILSGAVWWFSRREL